MTGLAIGIVIGSLIVGGLGVGLLFFRPLRSARKLEQRCVSELRQLKSLLSNRHLIVSHLADSIPASLDGIYERRRFQERLWRAEQGLQSLDPDNLGLEDMRALADNERALVELIDDLRESLEATESAGRIQAVSGCLDGLEKKTSEIRDAVATYNSAAITYAGFLSSSLAAQLQNLQCRFDILDLEPAGSSMSGDSGISSDRVAS